MSAIRTDEVQRVVLLLKQYYGAEAPARAAEIAARLPESKLAEAVRCALDASEESETPAVQREAHVKP